MASVLIIDDNAGTRETYSAILQLAGFQTATASNGRAGIDLARERTFDVHIVDLRLPDMSGVDVVRALKLNRAHGRALIVTAFPTLDTSFDAAAVGADGYVAGPLFDDDVVDVVDRAIAGVLPVRATLCPQTDKIGALARRICALVGLRTGPQELMAAALELRRAATDSAAVGYLFDHQPAPADAPPEVLTIIRCIESHVAAGELPRATDIAAELGIDSVEIGALLDLYTSAGYREWRRLFRLRAAICPLAQTSEQVAQIAFHIGYEHASQFDRDFHEAFGLTPGNYRRLVTRSPRRE